jgi:hypothetical protein
VIHARQRIQAMLSAMYRNYQLRRRLNQLHKECEAGEIGKKVILSDLKIRWKYRQFDTPLRTAIRYGQTKVIENLRSTIPTDKRDINGNSLVFLAASTLNEKIFRQVLFEVVYRSRPPPRPSIAMPPVKLDPETIISSGWMWKYRPEQRKIRRWCVLKPQKILYFKSPEDKIPRAAVDFEYGAMLKRSVDDKYAFEIECDSLPVRRNMFGLAVKKVMHFVAESEIMVTDWIFHIQYRLGVPVLKRSTGPVEYYSPTILHDQICTVNRSGESLLHGIIKSSKLSQIINSPAEDDAIAFADWFIMHGVNLSTRDTSGLTVKDYAMALGYTRWINYLIAKERCQANQAMVESTSGDLGDTRYANVGYTYINIYIQRQVIRTASNQEFNEDGKMMTISFKNAEGELLETSRLIRSPVLSSPRSILWSNLTKIRTPIDIIQAGSVIVFEQQSIGSTSTTNEKSTYVYNVKAESIQGGLVELQCISSNLPSTLAIEIMLSPY